MLFPDSDVANVEEFLNTHFLELLMYLYNDDKLPAIAFCFDKTRCENLVIQTMKQLEDMEMLYNRNTMAGMYVCMGVCTAMHTRSVLSLTEFNMFMVMYFDLCPSDVCMYLYVYMYVFVCVCMYL